MSYQRVQLIDTAALSQKYNQIYSSYYSQQPNNLQIHQYQNNIIRQQSKNQKLSYNNKENISPVHQQQQSQEKYSNNEQQKQSLRINSNFSNKINTLQSQQITNDPKIKQCKFTTQKNRIEQIRGSLDQLQIPQMQLAVNHDYLKLYVILTFLIFIQIKNQTQRANQKAAAPRQSPRIFDYFPTYQNKNEVYLENDSEKNTRQMSLQHQDNSSVKQNMIQEISKGLSVKRASHKEEMRECCKNRCEKLETKINNFQENAQLQKNEKKEEISRIKEQAYNNSQVVRAKSEQEKSRFKKIKFVQQEEQNNQYLLKQQNSQKQLLSHLTVTQMQFAQLFSFYYIPELIQSFRNQTSNDYFSQLFSSHFTQTMQAFGKINSWQAKQYNQYQEKQIQLGKQKQKKTIVFDLDETLIHCIKDSNIPGDANIPITLSNGEKISIKIQIRPYLKECLQILSQYYEIIVFTASQSSYANPIINYIDPEGLISYRLFREHCIKIDGQFCIKDLRILKNRDLDEMLLVDNIAFSYGLNIENGIPIIPFYNNKQDNQLINLTWYLKALYKYNKIAVVNNQIFQFFNLKKFDNPREFVKFNYLENLKCLYQQQ